MRRTWIAMLVVAGGLGPATFGQQYPPQNPQYPQQQYPRQEPPYQGDPRNNGQYDDGQSGQYNTDPGYNDEQGVYAPAPPPMPGYAYQRPPMPGPGYYWVDGYWNFYRGRYAWVGGYWMMPPYAGGYWVAPRYNGGRFFVGFWGGGRPGFNRGYANNNYRYQGNAQAYRPGYGAQVQSGPSFRGGQNHDARSGNRGGHGGRR